MPTSKRSLIILILFLLGYETILYFMVAVKQPLWHDEGHFIETIKYVAENISLERLKHYNEMSTPLPFLAYALWGKISSFNLPVLRMLSLIIARHPHRAEGGALLPDRAAPLTGRSTFRRDRR